MVKTEKRKLDMTHGPLLAKIILFVLPLLATNLLQVLYNSADMMVVSLSTEANAVGAISVTSPYVNLVLNLFVGFSVGTNVIVARHLGGKDAERTSSALHTAILTSLLFGIFGGALGVSISRPVLGLLGVKAALLDLSLLYTYIYLCGVPFISVTNTCISIFRAKGDTKTPLFVLMSTGLLNVILNLFFVLACDMSVEGVAIATTVANAVSMVILIILLMKEKGECRFYPKKLRLERKALLEILTIGLPAGVQGMLFSLSHMVIMSSILKIDAFACPPEIEYRPVVGGNGAISNLESFAYTATHAVHQASVTFTSQNTGAKEYDRVKRVMTCCYAVAFVVAIFFGLGIFLLAEPLLTLYDVRPGAPGTPEAIAYATALTRAKITMTVYFILAFMEIGSGVLRGLGRSLTSTLISLAGICAFRLLWIYTVFQAVGTLESIYISYPISWTITAVVQFALCILTLRRLINEKSEECTP